MIKIEEMNLLDFEEIKNNLQAEFDEFWNKDILKSELESVNSRYIVAKKCEKEFETWQIVGFAGIIILPDNVEIMNIVTRKTDRKKGIGNLLLDRLINMARELGKCDISLEVNEKNEIAINLYMKFGFEKVGTRKKYYNGTDDAIIMTKKL